MDGEGSSGSSTLCFFAACDAPSHAYVSSGFDDSFARLLARSLPTFKRGAIRVFYFIALLRGRAFPFVSVLKKLFNSEDLSLGIILNANFVVGSHDVHSLS